MKILNLILAVMFLLFAFVQINDPDPVIWILIYGAMAVVCILAAFHRYSRIALVVLMIAYVTYMVILLPGFTEWLRQDDKAALFDDIAKMQNLYIEETREFLGLLICVLVLSMHFIRSRKPQLS